MQSFTFQEIEATETPDKYTVRVHLKSAQRVLPAEPGRAGRGHVPARGARAGRRSQEAAHRDRAVHAQGAHPQGARGAAAQPRLLRQGPAVHRRVRHPLDSRRRHPAGRVPHRPGRFHLGREPVGGRRCCARRTPTPWCRRSTTRWRRSAWRWPRTGRPFNDVRVRRAHVRWPSTARRWWTRCSRATASSAGACPTSTIRTRQPTAKDFGPWWQYKPAEAKKLLTEAGHGKGFETTLFYYEYFPQMSSEVQLVQQDLKKNLNIDVKITKLDYTTYYGRYVDSKWDGHVVGLPVGPRHRGRRADLPVHALEVDRRTSSGSTIRSSTS